MVLGFVCVGGRAGCEISCRMSYFDDVVRFNPLLGINVNVR